jgi:hypothetical protein
MCLTNDITLFFNAILKRVPWESVAYRSSALFFNLQENIMNNLKKMTSAERLVVKEAKVKELEKKLTDKQTEWMKHIPKSYQYNYLKAMTGNSRAEKIKAKCLDCCNWLQIEIIHCSVTNCPLHSVRPYQQPQE